MKEGSNEGGQGEGGWAEGHKMSKRTMMEAGRGG